MKKVCFVFGFFLVLLFVSCTQIPDDKALVVIENQCDEFCSIDKVWYKDAGSLFGWKLVWDEADDDFHPKFAKFYMEEGSYDFKIRVYGYNIIPMEYRTGLLSPVELCNGTRTDIYFDGMSLCYKSQ